MKFASKNTMASLIALILMFAIVASLVALPNVNAHYPPWVRPVWAYVATTPTIIGIGQPVLIIFWVDWIPPTAQGEYGDRWTFYVDITRPDGTNETLGPFKSDPVGGSFTSYTPTQLGTYTVVSRFPEQKLTGLPSRGTAQSQNVNVNDTFLAAKSPPVSFTAQQEQIPAYEETPLPEDYWTRPINGQNRFWYEIAGPWLGVGMVDGPTTSINPYSTGPESAHVLWTRPYWSGGVMGGQTGAIAYYGGISYEGYGAPIMIMEGKLWYAQLTPPRYGYYCVDLYTGETIYWQNTTGTITWGGGFDASGTLSNGVPAFGQILDPEFPNQHGGMPYFWVTSTGVTNKWDLYDAFSGNYICSVANVSATGTQFVDKIGSICYVNLVNLGTTTAPNYRMQIWNTTEAIWYHPWYGTYGAKTALNGSKTEAYVPPTGTYPGSTSNAYWMWRPMLNYTFDGRDGFSMNVSIASILGPRNTLLNETGTIRAVRPDEFIIVGTQGQNDARGVVQGYLRAYSLQQNKWGQTLWDITFTPPKAAQDYPNSTYLGAGSAPSMGTVDPEDNVFTFEERSTLRRWVYSLETGDLLWESEPEGQFNYYGMSDSIYKGKLLTYGYSGELTAYNITTGKILWNWTAPDEGLGETWYPHSPLSLGCIADGKMYMYSSEHSPSSPLRRDNNIWCVDVETGKLLWKMSSWPAGPKIADGRLVLLNHFDEQIYCYGKGPSGTTVSAPQTVPPLGSSVTITGTVTDQSPSGRHNVAGSLDFALKGTPAISDADMEAWMEYLFQQRPIPTNAKGVEVTVDTIDPNGNYVPIGNTTSDMKGNYGLAFAPEVPGTYKIIATFAGSNSYGPSSATTYLTVGEATAQPTEQPAITLPPTEMYIVGVGVAMVIAIAIVGAILLLAIKKRL